TFHTVFFFQAEDGIRDRNVTGVQTCALPIYGQPAAVHVTHVPELVPAYPGRHRSLERRAHDAVRRPLGAPLEQSGIDPPQLREPPIFPRLPAPAGDWRVVGQAVVADAGHAGEGSLLWMTLEVGGEVGVRDLPHPR